MNGNLSSLSAFDLPTHCMLVAVFKGNYNLETTLPTATASINTMNLDYDTKGVPFATLGLADGCADCTANAYAIQGYLEAKAATNNWAKSVAKYREIAAGQSYYYSITGHGLGGMHRCVLS